MRSENTFGIQFFLRMNKAKNGKAPVYARVIVNGTRCEISLKRTIETAGWNDSRGLAKPKSTNLKLLNNYLEEVRGQLTSCYSQLHLEKKLLTAELLKNRWLGTESEQYTIGHLWSTTAFT